MTTRPSRCPSRRAAGLRAVCLLSSLAAGALLPAHAQPVLLAAGVGSGSRVAPAERHRSFEVELFGMQGLLGDPSGPHLAPRSSAGAGPDGAGRLEAVWPLGARSELRGQIAPLVGEMRVPVAAFQGQPFAIDADPASRSRLDAWRLTWRYSLLDSPQMSVKVGLTARMHDSRLALQPGASLTERAADTGIVPLLHASFEGVLASRLSMVADIDALGGSRGGTIDAGVRLRYAIDRDWSASVSYRILNSGSGTATLYDAPRFQYLGVGVRRAF